MSEAAMTGCTIGLLVTLILAILMAPLAVEAPPAGKVARIGYLSREVKKLERAFSPVFTL
jgi:hypothetical protein